MKIDVSFVTFVVMIQYGCGDYLGALSLKHNARQ